jgi:phage gpG-like protein
MSKFRFDKRAARFKREIPRLLDTMANNAVNHFKIDNFNAQGFIDDSVQRWPARKSKRDDAGRKILVKTGRGRESIKVLSRYGNKRKIGTLVPYMNYHNAGAGRLPKRQIIGNSKKLERKNARILKTFLKRIKSRTR